MEIGRQAISSKEARISAITRPSGRRVWQQLILLIFKQKSKGFAVNPWQTSNAAHSARHEGHKGRGTPPSRQLAERDLGGVLEAGELGSWERHPELGLVGATEGQGARRRPEQ